MQNRRQRLLFYLLNYSTLSHILKICTRVDTQNIHILYIGNEEMKIESHFRHNLYLFIYVYQFHGKKISVLKI